MRNWQKLIGKNAMMKKTYQKEKLLTNKIIYSEQSFLVTKNS